MDSTLHKPQINHPKQTSLLLTDCLSLSPAGFFEKNMNLSKEALCNFFKFWKAALVSFLNGDYIAHDALVGENACHIRTCALIDIAVLNNDYFHSTLVTMISDIKRINTSLANMVINNEDRKFSIQDFLYKNNLIFFYPQKYHEKIKYIIDTYLLTLTKESLPSSGFTINEKTSYQPVRSWGFTYNRAKFLIYKTQQSLSEQSCSYAIEEALQLNNKTFEMLLKIKKDGYGRSSLPQFFVAKVVFLRALEKNHHLLIKITRHFRNAPIDKVAFWFKSNNDSSNFELCKAPVTNTPCIVISGVVNYQDNPESLQEYQSRLLSFSMFEIILANFAIHPQYSGELKELHPPFEEVIESLTGDFFVIEGVDLTRKQLKCTGKLINGVLAEQKDFNDSRQFALQHGCALENPSLLFMNHVFCDIPAKHVQNISEQPPFTMSVSLQAD